MKRKKKEKKSTKKDKIHKPDDTQKENYYIR